MGRGREGAQEAHGARKKASLLSRLRVTAKPGPAVSPAGPK